MHNNNNITLYNGFNIVLQYDHQWSLTGMGEYVTFCRDKNT